MSDLICRRTMMRCQTPGMCSPHGGCQPNQIAAQPVAVNGMPERRPDVNKSFEGTDAEWYGNIGANEMHDAFTAWLSKAAQGLPEPLKLSDDVQEYLREGMENATGCEDDDVDFDFANGLEQLLYPLVRLEAVAPVFAERDILRNLMDGHRKGIAQLEAERDALREQVKVLQADPNSWQSGYDEGRRMGTKTAYAERESLRAEVEQLTQRIAIVEEIAENNARVVGERMHDNADLVGLLREVRPACYEEYHAVIDALLASTGGGERG